MRMNASDSILHNRQKVETTNCPPADDWTDTMWSSHTLEYYSAMKRKAAQIHGTTWMNLKNIMLWERNQSQKMVLSFVFGLYTWPVGS